MSNHFHTVGSVHIHVDGVHDEKQLLKLIRDLEKDGYPGKVHNVFAFVAGPQREELKELYGKHTSGFLEDERFNCFSTTLLPNHEDIEKVVTWLQEKLPKNSGNVLELEQMIATIDEYWESILFDQERMAFVKSNSKEIDEHPIEIHHAIDITKVGLEPPFSLTTLLAETEAHLNPGGWFLFKKKDVWAYRSNSFCRLKGFEEKARWENAFLKDYLSGLSFQGEYRVRTLVEKVLGMWKL